jgi:hypothetical protein
MAHTLVISLTVAKSYLYREETLFHARKRLGPDP